MNYLSLKKKLIPEIIESGWLPVSDYRLKYTNVVAEREIETIHGIKMAQIFLTPNADANKYTIASSFVMKDRNILDGFSSALELTNDLDHGFYEASEAFGLHCHMAMNVINEHFPRKCFLENPSDYRKVNSRHPEKFEVKPMTMTDADFFFGKMLALDAMIRNGFIAPDEQDFYSTQSLAYSSNGPLTSLTISYARPTADEAENNVVGVLYGGHRSSNSERPEGGGIPLYRGMKTHEISDAAIGYFDNAGVPFGFPVDDAYHAKKLHVLKALTAKGWTPFDGLSFYCTNGLGYKMNDTVAAKTEAQLFFTSINDPEYTQGVIGYVSGEYNTMGQNAVINMRLEITESMDEDEVVAKTGDFIDKIQGAIDRTTFRSMHLEQSNNSPTA